MCNRNAFESESPFAHIQNAFDFCVFVSVFVCAVCSVFNCSKKRIAKILFLNDIVGIDAKNYFEKNKLPCKTNHE